jgi:perosamine synthetase
MKKDLSQIVAQESTSILKSLSMIDKNAMRILFVTNENSEFLGTVTDGDLRRAIMSGADLQENISSYIFKNPIINEPNKNPDKINDEILSRGIQDEKVVIPFVENKKVVDYEVFTNGHIRYPIASPVLGSKEMEYVVDCIQTSWISSQGPYVKKFEKSLADFHKSQNAITTSSGTTAIHLALAALDIGPGDEVIVPDLTFAATINAVIYTGATPVIVDVDETSYNVTANHIKSAITKKTKAIIPVHLYGMPCDMPSIMKLAKDHDLFVIEDCAEALGATFADKLVGTYGDVGCFSFFGNKVVTTGEGGACITNNNQLATKMRKLRDHGMNRDQKRLYYHDVIGFNYRLTNLQAAVGFAQMEKIDEILKQRDLIKKWYAEELDNISSLQKQVDHGEEKSVCWLVSYTLKNKSADLIEKLRHHDIDARPFFYPLSQMPAYEKHKTIDTPITNKLSQCGFNLPTSLNLTKTDIKHICDKVKLCLSELKIS